MAVAAGGKGERAVGVLHGKTGRTQGQCPPQPRAGKSFSADGHRSYISGFVQLRRAKPGGGGGVSQCLRLQTKALQNGIHLLAAVGDGRLVAVGRLVPGGGHSLQVGQGRGPHVLAGLGHAVADAVVAGGGRCTAIAQQCPGGSVRQRGKAAVVGSEIIAPARFQYLGIRPPGAEGRIDLHRRPQRQCIAVAGHHLG